MCCFKGILSIILNVTFINLKFAHFCLTPVGGLKENELLFQNTNKNQYKI